MQGLNKYLICRRWAFYKSKNKESENKDFIYEAVINGKDDSSVESINKFVFTFTAGNVLWNDLFKDFKIIFSKISIV
jgi:hypothetical protein